MSSRCAGRDARAARSTTHCEWRCAPHHVTHSEWCCVRLVSPARAVTLHRVPALVAAPGVTHRDLLSAWHGWSVSDRHSALAGLSGGRTAGGQPSFDRCCSCFVLLQLSDACQPCLSTDGCSPDGGSGPALREPAFTQRSSSPDAASHSRVSERAARAELRRPPPRSVTCDCAAGTVPSDVLSDRPPTLVLHESGRAFVAHAAACTCHVTCDCGSSRRTARVSELTRAARRLCTVPRCCAPSRTRVSVTERCFVALGE